MAYTDDLANLPNISFDRILMLAKDNVPPKKTRESLDWA